MVLAKYLTNRSIKWFFRVKLCLTNIRLIDENLYDKCRWNNLRKLQTNRTTKQNKIFKLKFHILTHAKLF